MTRILRLIHRFTGPNLGACRIDPHTTGASVCTRTAWTQLLLQCPSCDAQSWRLLCRRHTREVSRGLMVTACCQSSAQDAMKQASTSAGVTW